MRSSQEALENERSMGHCLAPDHAQDSITLVVSVWCPLKGHTYLNKLAA